MERNQIVRVLIDVCAAFFDRLDRDTLIRRILESAIELTHGDRGTIFQRWTTRPGGEATHLTALIATGMEGRELRIPADKGVVGHVFQKGEAVIVDDARLDSRFFSGVDQKTHYETKTILCVPLKTPSGECVGAIEILNSKKGRFTEEDRHTLEILAQFASVALEQRRTIDSLIQANEQLREEQSARLSYLHLGSTNRQLQDFYNRLPALAESGSSVVVEGSSGTGKELIAHLIHERSPRSGRPFIAVNCAAIPESLFEAELFGVERGAATGTSARKGKVELADGGTLFLDEVGELPLTMQAKLLRVIQEREVARVGSEREPRPVDFRLVSATNRDLEAMVRKGEFREDLYYRICVVKFRMPDLRERPGDVPQICKEVLARFSAERGWKPKVISDAAMDRIIRHPWPGNIRELKNRLEAAVIMGADRREIQPEDLQLGTPGALPSNVVPIRADLNLGAARDDLERGLISVALKRSHGNRAQAAKLLGITRQGLAKAVERLKIAPEASQSHKRAA